MAKGKKKDRNQHDKLKITILILKIIREIIDLIEDFG